MRILKSSLLAAGLLSFSLQSHALVSVPVAQASIDWSSFSYQLFDLNPSDNVTPSLTWSMQATEVAWSANNAQSGDAASSEDWTTGLSVSGSGLDVVADVTGQSVTANSYSATYSYGYADRVGSFKLTGDTLVVFSVNASVSVLDDADPETESWAFASISAHSPSGFGQNSQLSDEYLNAGNSNGFPLSETGTIKAHFVNASGQVADGEFATSVHADTLTSPVPEPHTYGMLLAGLAVMAQLARRRRAD